MCDQFMLVICKESLMQISSCWCDRHLQVEDRGTRRRYLLDRGTHIVFQHSTRPEEWPQVGFKWGYQPVSLPWCASPWRRLLVAIMCETDQKLRASIAGAPDWLVADDT